LLPPAQETSRRIAEKIRKYLFILFKALLLVSESPDSVTEKRK
jgi:hypothetical protein